MAGVRRVPNVAVQDALKELVRMKENKGKVGWLESNTYKDGTSVAYVAIIQEMGSPKNGIPPRPFFRPTIAAKSNTWKNQFKSGCKAILAGNETASTVMEKVVQGAAGDVRKTIKQINSPALSPVTLQLRYWKRNGIQITGKKMVAQAAHLVALGLNNTLSGTAAKPLNDTGLMLQTLTYSVGSEK
jgi:hypothetical protein